MLQNIWNASQEVTWELRLSLADYQNPCSPLLPVHTANHIPQLLVHLGVALWLSYSPWDMKELLCVSAISHLLKTLFVLFFLLYYHPHPPALPFRDELWEPQEGIHMLKATKALETRCLKRPLSRQLHLLLLSWEQKVNFCCIWAFTTP